MVPLKLEVRGRFVLLLAEDPSRLPALCCHLTRLHYHHDIHHKWDQPLQLKDLILTASDRLFVYDLVRHIQNSVMRWVVKNGGVVVLQSMLMHG